MYKVAKIVKVVDVYHRRSPLVQGGLEPVGVTLANWPSRNNYEALVQEKYKEPINGQFEDVTATILREIEDSGFEMELERS